MLNHKCLNIFNGVNSLEQVRVSLNRIRLHEIRHLFFALNLVDK